MISNAMQRAIPNLQQELELRVRPLKEQWEARGPGLLKTFANLTEESLLVEEAKVLLVHPVLGGGGEAHTPGQCSANRGGLSEPQSATAGGSTVRLGCWRS